VNDDAQINNEPAFPSGVYPDANQPGFESRESGMTLRDYIAVRASEQDVENHRPYNADPSTGQPIYTLTIEQAKYAYADAMLAARSA
jgi:hypothetical protein